MLARSNSTWLFGGQAAVKRRAVVNSTDSPCSATMLLDNPPDGRKTNAGSFEILIGMEPLEYSEQPGGVVHIESDSVVSDVENNVCRVGTYC